MTQGKANDAAEHQHKFVIPVEWTITNIVRNSWPLEYSVTKLRCECGKEIER